MPWGVDVPAGFYEDPDGGLDPARFRCPKLWVTRWSDAIAQLHYASQTFHASPAPGPVVLWPAKLREALLYYESQLTARRRKAAEEARAKAQQPRGYTSR